MFDNILSHPFSLPADSSTRPAEEETAPLDLSKKEPIPKTRDSLTDAPLNLSLRSFSSTPLSQTSLQGSLNTEEASRGTVATVASQDQEDTTDEQKHTAAFALCQLAQGSLPEQPQSSETGAQFNKHVDFRADEDPDNAPPWNQLVSSSPTDSCQNKMSTQESVKTDNLELLPSATDASSPISCTEDASKHKARRVERVRGQNAKRRRGSAPSKRIPRKRLCC